LRLCSGFQNSKKAVSATSQTPAAGFADALGSLHRVPAGDLSHSSLERDLQNLPQGKIPRHLVIHNVHTVHKKKKRSKKRKIYGYCFGNIFK
jgi:hypothetical protein